MTKLTVGILPCTRGLIYNATPCKLTDINMKPLDVTKIEGQYLNNADMTSTV